jgi:hypothetical protein
MLYIKDKIGILNPFILISKVVEQAKICIEHVL